jgi:hypothetical protein
MADCYFLHSNVKKINYDDLSCEEINQVGHNVTLLCSRFNLHEQWAEKQNVSGVICRILLELLQLYVIRTSLIDYQRFLVCFFVIF